MNTASIPLAITALIVWLTGPVSTLKENDMDWHSFIIGVAVGWGIAQLVPRRSRSTKVIKFWK